MVDLFRFEEKLVELLSALLVVVLDGTTLPLAEDAQRQEWRGRCQHQGRAGDDRATQVAHGVGHEGANPGQVAGLCCGCWCRSVGHGRKSSAASGCSPGGAATGSGSGSGGGSSSSSCGSGGCGSSGGGSGGSGGGGLLCVCRSLGSVDRLDHGDDGLLLCAGRLLLDRRFLNDDRLFGRVGGGGLFGRGPGVEGGGNGPTQRGPRVHTIEEIFDLINDLVLVVASKIASSIRYS